MDCTTLHLEKRTIYRGLALLVLLALVVAMRHAAGGPQSQGMG